MYKSVLSRVREGGPSGEGQPAYQTLGECTALSPTPLLTSGVMGAQTLCGDRAFGLLAVYHPWQKKTWLTIGRQFSGGDGADCPSG